MKIPLLFVIVALLFASAAPAETAGTPQERKTPAPPGQSGREPQMPPKQMSQKEMMMQDMVQMMADIVKMQENILTGSGPEQKKEMLKQLSDMTARVNTMIAGMKGLLSAQPSPVTGPPYGAGAGRVASPAVGMPKLQERTEGEVTAKVALESANGSLVFRIDLDSPTVSVDHYKFADGVRLRAAGREYEPRVRSEEGSILHHSAVVEFGNPGTPEYQLIIRDTSQGPGMVFSFPD